MLLTFDVMEMRCLAVVAIVVCSLMIREGVPRRQTPSQDRKSGNIRRLVGFVELLTSSRRDGEELGRINTNGQDPTNVQPTQEGRQIERRAVPTTPEQLLYPNAFASTAYGHSTLDKPDVTKPCPHAKTSSQQTARGRKLRTFPRVWQMQPRINTDAGVVAVADVADAANAVTLDHEPDLQLVLSATNYFGTAVDPKDATSFSSKTIDDQPVGKSLPSLIAIFDRESSSVRHEDGGEKSRLKMGTRKDSNMPCNEKIATACPPVREGGSAFTGSSSKGSSKSSLKSAPSSNCEKTSKKGKEKTPKSFGCKTRTSALPTSPPTVIRSMLPSAGPAEQVTTVFPSASMSSPAPSNVPSSISPTSSPTDISSSEFPSDSPGGSPSGSPAGSPSGSPSDSPSGSPSGSPSDSPSDSPGESTSVSPSGSPILPTAVPSESPSERQCGTLINCVLVDLIQGTVVANLTAMNTVMYTVSDNASFSISCELMGHADSIVSVYRTGETHMVTTNAPNQLYWLEGDAGGVPNPVSYLATVGDKSIDVNVTLGGTSCVNFTQLLVGRV